MENGEHERKKMRMTRRNTKAEKHCDNEEEKKRPSDDFPSANDVELSFRES